MLTKTLPQQNRFAHMPRWLFGALCCGSVVVIVVATYVLAYLAGADLLELSFILSTPLAALVGGLIVAHQPRNSVGWLILAHAACFAIGEFCRRYALYGVVANPGSLLFARAAAWPTYWIWLLGILFGFVLLPLHFPNGRLPTPRWRIARWLVIIGLCTVSAISSLLPSDAETPGVPNPLGMLPPVDPDSALSNIFGLIWIISTFVGLGSLVVRFRLSRGAERKQVQWLMYAVAMLLALTLLTPNMLVYRVSVLLLGLTALWLAIGFAVLRYRLYDIDILLNRTLLYGALSAVVVGLYVLVVAYLGALFQGQGTIVLRDGLPIQLVGTVIVALVFQPLRDQLQRGINRLLYGSRNDPYALLSLLGQSLAITSTPSESLVTIVETVGQALKLPYVAILLSDQENDVAAQHGSLPEGDLVALPLFYQGVAVGMLHVALRSGETMLTQADQRVLDELARQIGVVVAAARLTDDLQHARERLVTAREEERRRLRRDLHDGLGPTLAAQTLKVGSARHFLRSDPTVSDSLLASLEGDIGVALQEVRRLVYDLRPPALDDLGLLGTLRLIAADYATPGDKHRLSVSMQLPEQIPPLPAAVEVAVYRITQEALTNVVRHAAAQHCIVRLVVTNTALTLDIFDDGRGIGAGGRSGVGMHSMRERAAELGGTCTIALRAEGGTHVAARLPVNRADAVPVST